jgi:hypothetical protein
MTREDAERIYHQCRDMLDGRGYGCTMAYPINQPERLKYEAAMAELLKRFPGIDEKLKK